MKLSLVIPCFNEQDNVFPFYQKVKKVIQNKFDYEFIFVNDGSKDHTQDRLKELTQEYTEENIVVINFSRNFGKESAMYAGLKEAVGDYVCIIDADLQQDPKYVLEMTEELDKDDSLDCVAAYQEQRKENALLGKVKSMFYSLMNKMSDVEFVNGASDFRCFRKNVIDVVVELPERNRFSKGIFSWVGFNTKYIPYQVLEREAGTTSWSFFKLLKYAIDGFVSYSVAPLKVSTFLGLIISFFAFLYMVFVIMQKIFWGIEVDGYATIIVLILFMGGGQLLCLGIMGEYLSRTYTESKQRPICVIKNKYDYKQGDSK